MAVSESIDGGPISAIQFLPRVVEDLAQQCPSEIWMTLPKSSDDSGEWRSIDYRELSNAVDGMTRWMEAILGDGVKPGNAIAYIGQVYPQLTAIQQLLLRQKSINDMRYMVVEIAVIKAGCKILLPSPRNSQSGHQSLFHDVACCLLLHSEGVETHIENVTGVLPEVRSFQIPDFDELRNWASKTYRPLLRPERSEDEQVVVLHTSGSTGHPKPVYHTNASISVVGTLREFTSAEGRQNIADPLLQSGKSAIIVAPFFHIMGQTMLWRSLLCRAPLVVLSPQKPPDAESVIQAIKQTRPSMAFFPPSILEGMANIPDGTDAISLLETVYFASGPLATGVGEKLLPLTNLLNMLGSTEMGICPSRIPLDKRDWQYIECIPESGAKMEFDLSGLYELVIQRTDDNKKYQAVFHTMPAIREWRTKDLFERHPEKEDLWLYKGRKDDLLVLSNGEKFNPVGFEKLIESHPKVKGALVVGQGRFQTALLIEPEWTMMPSTQAPSEIVDLMWPLVEKASATNPAHSKVWKSRIAVAQQDKPFKRAPKGSIIRSQTVDLYGSEIDALYFQEPARDDLERLPPHADLPAIKKFLRQAFQLNGLRIPDSSSDDDEIFSYGIDSLQVLELSSAVNRALHGASTFSLSIRDVYTYPTVNSLAKHIRRSLV